MKNKAVYPILVLLLMFASFFSGGYLERQKNKTIPITLPAEVLTKEGPTSQKLTVTEVTDGDTLKLSTGQTFRLYGVNAPEVKEPLFEEAKVFTQNFALNKEVTFEQEANYQQDKFGRTLGYIFVDGKNLNLELVKAGLARVVLYEKRAKIKYQDELLSAENTAKVKRLGVWK